MIHKDDHTPEEFNKVCNIICEYAQQKNYNPAVGAYFAEHGNKITGPQALQVFCISLENLNQKGVLKFRLLFDTLKSMRLHHAR